MNAMEMSAITEAQGWEMFDNMTAAALVIDPSRMKMDENVAEIVLLLAEPIKMIIRTQFLAKGYIPV